jgi:hypothetical protein
MGMTNEDIRTHQRRAREFGSTEVGQALACFENATINYWIADQRESATSKRLSELDEKAKQTRERLVNLLRPLLGLADDA